MKMKPVYFFLMGTSKNLNLAKIFILTCPQGHRKGLLHFFSVIFRGALIAIILSSCGSKKPLLKQDVLSFDTFVQQEKSKIAEDFYFFFQDMMPPKLIISPQMGGSVGYYEDLYEQIAFPYQDTVIILVKVNISGDVTEASVLKNGTDAQNAYCLNLARKLKFQPAYLGGTKFPTEIQIVFNKVR